MSENKCCSEYCENKPKYLDLEEKKYFCGDCMFPQTICDYCYNHTLNGKEAEKLCGICKKGICFDCSEYTPQCFKCDRNICQDCSGTINIFNFELKCVCGNFPLCPCIYYKNIKFVDLFAQSEQLCSKCGFGKCEECINENICYYCKDNEY